MIVTEDAQGRPQFITPGETEGLSWHHRPEVIATTRQYKCLRFVGVPSPTPGVTWDKARQCWRAYVGGGKSKRIHLGRFVTIRRAISARKKFLASIRARNADS